jgi:hypothetical protein
VPSTAELFLAAGYVVQSAQDSLLGVPAPSDFPNSYFIDAANFTRDALLILLQRISDVGANAWDALTLHHSWLVILTGLLVVTVFIARRVDLAKRRIALRGVQVLVIVTILSKFLLLDAPLLRVEGLIANPQGSTLAEDQSCWSLLTIVRLQPGATPRTAWHCPVRTTSLIEDKTEDLYDTIVCARLGSTPAEIGAAAKTIDKFALSPVCTGSQAATLPTQVQDAFICNLLVGLAIVLCVLGLARTGTHSRITILLEVISTIYLLSIPYSYGKLLKPTLFQFGVIRMSPPLSADYLKQGYIVGGSDTMAGLLLSKGPGSSTFLVPIQKSCGTDYDKMPKTIGYMWEFDIPTSQILAFEQLSDKDVIYEAAMESHACARG